MIICGLVFIDRSQMVHFGNTTVSLVLFGKVRREVVLFGKGVVYLVLFGITPQPMICQLAHVLCFE